MQGRLLWLIGALAAIGVSSASCAGKVIVTPVPSPEAVREKAHLDGVLYALPFTVVTVTVPVVKTRSTKGRDVAFIDLFLPETFARKDYITADSDLSFSIGKPVFATYGEPDLSRLYYVKLSGGLTADRTASLDYTDRGTVSGVKGETVNHLSDLVVATIGTAAGVVIHGPTFGARGIKGGAAPPAPLCPAESTPADARAIDFFTRGGAPELQYNYCRLSRVRRDAILTAIAATTNGSDPALGDALNAYRDIRDLREARHRLITQADMDASLPSLELMLREIDAAFALATSTFFTGRKSVATWSPTFELRPKTLAEPATALLRYDADQGVCTYLAQPMQGDPLPGFIAAKACVAKATRVVRVTFVLDSQPQLFQRVASVYSDDDRQERSFRYRIPASALATVEIAPSSDTAARAASKISVAAVTTLSIAQFGTVASLPASSGGRSLNYELKFFEATGALKSFTLASKAAIQESSINAMSSTTNGLLDAQSKKDQAANAQADTLTKLSRQRQILEEEAKIKALCLELGRVC